MGHSVNRIEINSANKLKGEENTVLSFLAGQHYYCPIMCNRLTYLVNPLPNQAAASVVAVLHAE